LDPSSGVRLSEYVALPPGETATDEDEPDAGPIEKSAPVPESATLCGLPYPLSETKTVPSTVPLALGSMLTYNVHAAPTGTLNPQLLVSLKLAVAEMLVMFSGPGPEFVSVTGCAGLVVPASWVENVRLLGVSVTAGIGTTPVPAILTV
jgi:hypothetical protein